MRHLILSLLLIDPALPAAAAECASIVRSVCEMRVEGPSPARKVLKVKPGVTPYVVGDRFPVDDHSFVMDPVRHGLAPSDGTWRYYAVAGVVYRVLNASGEVVQVIRNHRTSHMR